MRMMDERELEELKRSVIRDGMLRPPTGGPPEETIVPDGGRPVEERSRPDADGSQLEDVRRAAGSCLAWGMADPDTHPHAAKARHAAGRLTVLLAEYGLDVPSMPVPDDYGMLCDRMGVLYERLIGMRLLPLARCVNRAWADLTEVDG